MTEKSPEVEHVAALKNWRHLAATIVGWALVLFHLLTGWFVFLPNAEQRSAHLTLVLLLVFLMHPFGKKSDRGSKSSLFDAIDILAIGLAIFIGAYVYFFNFDILWRAAVPPFIDIFISIALIIILLDATRRSMGMPMVIVALCALIYGILGPYMPKIIQHSGFSPVIIITQIGLGSEGIFGLPLGVSASTVANFVILGAVLLQTGISEFFTDVADLLVGRVRGGTAKIAIVASAMFGTISGSPTANVLGTGMITIPAMKGAGFPATIAGAVEAVASTGGMIMPPVMGAAAFIIPEVLGISYGEVMIAAAIPAILYFAGVFFQVDLFAAKNGMVGERGKKFDFRAFGKLIATRFYLIIPIFVLLYLLMVMDISPSKAAFWATVTSLIICVITKGVRATLRALQGTLRNIQLGIVIIAVGTATAGIIVGVTSITGIGVRMASILVEIMHGNFYAILLASMVASIICGMGLPPTASYIVVSVVTAPILINMGTDPLATHLFVFYFSIIGCITPPVAITAFAAASIAGSEPMKTGWVATRLGIAGYLVPFFFVQSPLLILKGDILPVCWAVLTACIGMYLLSVAMEGFFINRSLNRWMRLLAGAGAVMMIDPKLYTDIIGLVLLLILIVAYKFPRFGFVRGKNGSRAY